MCLAAVQSVIPEPDRVHLQGSHALVTLRLDSSRPSISGTRSSAETHISINSWLPLPPYYPLTLLFKVTQKGNYSTEASLVLNISLKANISWNPDVFMYFIQFFFRQILYDTPEEEPDSSELRPIGGAVEVLKGKDEPSSLPQLRLHDYTFGKP